MVEQRERYGLRYCRMKKKREREKAQELAMKAVEASKKLIMKKDYNRARECIEVAMEHNPGLENGFGMWVICETLYRADIDLSNRKVDWYSVLHLPPSTNNEEVQKRSEELLNEISGLMGFPGAKGACCHLRMAAFSLSKPPMRERLDTQRMASCMFDRPKIESRKSSLREVYLGWKPPVYNFDVSENLKSKKRSSTATCSRCAEAEDEEGHEGSSLSPELRNLKTTHKVFGEMPQNPHYGPLQKYSQKVREGFIWVLDLAFISLFEEIHNVVDPQHFLSKLTRFNDQLAELKEMGYNVEKLQQHLDTLEEAANRDRLNRAAMDLFEVEVSIEETKIIGYKSRIMVLEEEIKRSQVLIDSRKRKIEALKKESQDAAIEFLSKVKYLRGNEV